MFGWFKGKRKEPNDASDCYRHHSDYKYETIKIEFQHKDVTVGLLAYGLNDGIFISASKEKTSKSIACWHPGTLSWIADEKYALTSTELREISEHIYDLLNDSQQHRISKEDFKIKVEAVLRAYISEDILDKYADAVEEEYKNKAEKEEFIAERIKQKESEIRGRFS